MHMVYSVMKYTDSPKASCSSKMSYGLTVSVTLFTLARKVWPSVCEFSQNSHNAQQQRVQTPYAEFLPIIVGGFHCADFHRTHNRSVSCVDISALNIL